MTTERLIFLPPSEDAHDAAASAKLNKQKIKQKGSVLKGGPVNGV